MLYTKILQFATSATLGGCLYITNKWRQRTMQVNAQPLTPFSPAEKSPFFTSTPSRGSRGATFPEPFDDLGEDSSLFLFPPEYSGFLPDSPRAHWKDAVVQTGPQFEAPQMEQYGFKFPDWPTDVYPLGPLFPHPEVPSRQMFEGKDFFMCYDNRTKLPAWTLEMVTKEMVGCPKGFHSIGEDGQVEKEFRSGMADYVAARKGFKEVLLADPMFHCANVEETTRYSNVVPQASQEKTDAATIWDGLTRYVRYLTNLYDEVYVLSGPIFCPERAGFRKFKIKYGIFGDKKVAIPTHFFKVILARNPCDGKFRLECYKFPNECTRQLDLVKYHVKRYELEKDLGFLIFDKVWQGNISHTNMDMEYAKVISASGGMNKKKFLKQK